MNPDKRTLLAARPLQAAGTDLDARRSGVRLGGVCQMWAPAPSCSGVKHEQALPTGVLDLSTGWEEACETGMSV
jgi:hypothetical protein